MWFFRGVYSVGPRRSEEPVAMEREQGPGTDLEAADGRKVLAP